MRPTVVLDVVGLSESLLGPDTPELCALLRCAPSRTIQPVLPAVTASVQSTYLTGVLPREHGIVGNGWYFRDLSEVWLWRQSNRLVGGEKIWETARKKDPSFTCAQLFWWYNMYARVDISVTPRPIYWADGLKLPDIYTQPAELREELNGALGEFPLHAFWGPAAGIASSRWIASCAMRVVDRFSPSLTLVYLPHLDYVLQRKGPNREDPEVRRELAAIDALIGDITRELIEHAGVRVVILSEYGISPVSGPVHINRILREHDLVAVRKERGLEKLDPGASAAFAVADHQIAHVYVRDIARVPYVAGILKSTPGIDRVLDGPSKRATGIDHERCGDLVAIAAPDRWFSYYYWDDDSKAPEFARTIDIHRKPGYDPAELFFDPALSFPRLRVGWTLLKKKLGFRTLLDVIPLDASLVQGSHGRADAKERPVIWSSEPDLLPARDIGATEVKQILLDHVFLERPRPRSLPEEPALAPVGVLSR